MRSALAQSGTPTRQPDGTWAVEFSLTLENTGTVPTSDLSLLNDLTDPSQLGDTWVSTTNVLLDPAGVTIGTAPGLNPDWATDPTQDIFDGSGTLNPGESITVTYTTMVDPDASGFSIPLEIQATASGTGSSNEDGDPLADPTNTPYPTVVDLSDSGTDPNGDNPERPVTTELAARTIQHRWSFQTSVLLNRSLARPLPGRLEPTKSATKSSSAIWEPSN